MVGQYACLRRHRVMLTCEVQRWNGNFHYVHLHAVAIGIDPLPE